VEPALEQGQIDLVVEYSGSALNFLQQRGDAADADAAATHAALRSAFDERDITVADAAPAQNQNAFAVASDTAERLELSTLSDLGDHAAGLVFGGPAECAQRLSCLRGLEEVYGVVFERILKVRGSANVSAALHAGEIDVGLLFTTDPALARSDFVVLDDDQGLQPAENVTPVVRTAVVRQAGRALVDRLDEVSAELTTTELAHLNLRVDDGREPQNVAREWLERHDLTPGHD
jgi:osmoprotectant transport system substrate-binding protein